MAGETTREALEAFDKLVQQVRNAEFKAGGEEREFGSAKRQQEHIDRADAKTAELRDLVRAALSREEGTPWRPIETAPKDGTPIRLYASGLRDEDFNPSGSVEGFWSDDQGWLGAVWNPQHDFWMALPMKPTHWMPLPIGLALDTNEEEGA